MAIGDADAEPVGAATAAPDRPAAASRPLAASCAASTISPSRWCACRGPIACGPAVCAPTPGGPGGAAEEPGFHRRTAAHIIAKQASTAVQARGAAPKTCSVASSIAPNMTRVETTVTAERERRLPRTQHTLIDAPTNMIPFSASTIAGASWFPLRASGSASSVRAWPRSAPARSATPARSRAR